MRISRTLPWDPLLAVVWAWVAVLSPPPPPQPTASAATPETSAVEMASRCLMRSLPCPLTWSLRPHSPGTRQPAASGRTTGGSRYFAPSPNRSPSGRPSRTVVRRGSRVVNYRCRTYVVDLASARGEEERGPPGRQGIARALRPMRRSHRCVRARRVGHRRWARRDLVRARRRSSGSPALGRGPPAPFMLERAHRRAPRGRGLSGRGPRIGAGIAAISSSRDARHVLGHLLGLLSRVEALGHHPRAGAPVRDRRLDLCLVGL